MSMTREEAISRILDHMEVHRMGQYPHIKIKEALDLALAALRGPTREMVKRMRGEWVRHEGYDECANCSEKTIYGHNFCPRCGQPKTDEAVDMMLERWKGVLNENT